uniref:PAS domain-containing protein n=1 Tax=Onchocerca flexuosa TaxID=387005 RepID=A0A183HRN8_9BILA
LFAYIPQLFFPERGEQQRTVTAFINEAAATSRARELLEKCTESVSVTSLGSNFRFKLLMCNDVHSTLRYGTGRSEATGVSITELI